MPFDEHGIMYRHMYGSLCVCAYVCVCKMDGYVKNVLFFSGILKNSVKPYPISYVWRIKIHERYRDNALGRRDNVNYTFQFILLYVKGDAMSTL